MSEWIDLLQVEFSVHANPQKALLQKAYLKNQFEFFGLTAPERREIQKPFLAKAFLPPKVDLKTIVKELWLKPEREYQYFAQELAFKYVKQMEEKDIDLFEFMVINKSWWDTVDFIAVKLMGSYFQNFPKARDERIEIWLKSQNIWLQRSALLFQLKYKNDLDDKLLSFVINTLLGSKAFFINKAIGWILREYSRTNPLWVRDFCARTPLNNLSKKEALRFLL